ncbi:transcription factor GTE1 isoform X2 [Rhodamnia argentea]|uniref:Transcription factor GTE1 isoform X2 n=1 Tax=Rhodamnia argentea TaxID=178133 RepID=A0A8B8Q9P4_9MYRT|nr:transcription factor GTE1 isoform X2 [Rhodamnia argentea]
MEEMEFNSSSEVEPWEHHLDQILVKVNELEKSVNEIEQFYHDQSKKQPSTSKGSTLGKDERQINGLKKLQQDGCSREATAAKRMQQLISHFGVILRQITQHKWAGPFLQPVDVKALGLHDYHKVIDKPMDFSTIKKQMEATDGTSYKNVREICADMRLVFKNAMKYNDEKSNIHVMAKTLLRKFEEKWLQLLPKVTEEEKRLEQEEAEALFDMQLAKEAANARMAREISSELYEVDMHLERLRAIVISKCRKISTDEKRKIAAALDKLPVEDVDKALEIVAQYDSSFQSKGDLVDLDLDAQSECTLWKLKFFVKGALEVQGKSSTAVVVDSNHERSNNNGGNNNSNKKRKKEICNAIARTAKKRSVKPSS